MSIPLTQFSVANYPHYGWVVNNKTIHPPSAYTDKMEFIINVLNNFPDKKEKFLAIFNGNAVRMHYLEEMAVFKLCEWLNKITK